MNKDITALYQQTVRDHSRNPRHQHGIENATISRRLDNPSCGDWVEIFLRISDGDIGEAAFDGEGCALAIASADILCGTVRGLPLDTARELAAEFLAALDGDEEAADRIEESSLVSLLAARAFPGRLGCVRLAWNAFSPDS